MVRECRPPAREPARSWPARRSTMATSTPANANSPASISPVGPPPATTTACPVIAAPRPASRRPPPARRAPQPHRDPHHRFDVPVRPVRRRQHTHFAPPISVGSGFGRHYAARPGACFKPPVRCILEVEGGASQPNGARLIRAGAAIRPGPSSCPYSPECVERLSEKPRIRPRGGPARGQKGPFGPFDRPYTALIHALSVAPNPFSDSFRRGILGS